MSTLQKIAIMLPRFSNYGGVEQFGVRLASALAAKGYEVDFICARQESEPPAGVRVLSTGRPRGAQFIKMFWFCAATEFLRRRGNYACSISLGKTWNQDILRIGGGPLKVFWNLSSKSLHHKSSRLWKSIRRRLSPSNWLTLIIENHQYKGKSQIIAVSHLVEQWILRSHPEVDPKRITLVYNKPDLGRFRTPSTEERSGARIVFGVPDNAIAVGTASSNFKLKGIGPLIRSLEKLPENFHLFIAGGRRHGEYDALAKKLGVGGRVHFVGKVDHMAEFYHSLDIFALPTFYDACSNAVLEALASGVHVLSSKSNGSAYFLDEKNLINDPGSAEELAEKILNISSYNEASDPAKVENMNRPEIFSWPTDLRVGVEGVVEVVEAFLQGKVNDSAAK